MGGGGGGGGDDELHNRIKGMKVSDRREETLIKPTKDCLILGELGKG